MVGVSNRIDGGMEKERKHSSLSNQLQIIHYATLHELTLLVNPQTEFHGPEITME